MAQFTVIFEPREGPTMRMSAPYPGASGFRLLVRGAIGLAKTRLAKAGYTHEIGSVDAYVDDEYIEPERWDTKLVPRDAELRIVEVPSGQKVLLD